MTSQSTNGIAVNPFTLSNEIVQLFNSAAVRNVNEAIVVLYHAFLLESGFRPQELSDADICKMMPKDWNTKGIYKIKYFHYCCPSFTCFVTFVPLYTNVSVHGIICDSDCFENVNLKMNLSKYLRQRKDFSNVNDVFSYVDELSRHFKDNFCLPLLNLLHETIGGKRLYGFPGLFHELKIAIMTILPVESIVALSSVNKNLHELANAPFLWKYLFKRDFAKDGVLDIETTSKTDWKKMYKEEYIKNNRKREPRHDSFQDYSWPVIFNWGPDFDSDLAMHFDPPFPGPYFQPPGPYFQPPVPYFPHLPPFFRR